jgi:uncharacterized membrane protein
MKCPYCLEAVTSGAFACKTCGRDVHLVIELQQRVDSLEEELSKGQESITSATGKPIPRSRPLEAGAVLTATALFPLLLYDLRSDFSWSAILYFTLVVVCSAIAGFLVGSRSIHRSITLVILGICLAAIQAVATAIAFGYTYHVYYHGFDLAHTVIGWAKGLLWERQVWISQALPAAIFFAIAAFVGQSLARTRAGCETVGSRIAARFTDRHLDELQMRVDRYAKLFDTAVHVIVVLLGVVTSFYTVKQAKGFKVDPAANNPVAESYHR